MMRSRDHGTCWGPPPWQYHPHYLVYEDGTSWHNDNMYVITSRIRNLLPLALRPAFRLLCRGFPREKEGEVLPVVRWIEANGKRCGFRIPNVHERMAATGQFDYLNSLALPARGLYDMTGNHFDPDALILRIITLMWDWARGVELPEPPVPLHPPFLHRNLDAVASMVRAHGLEPEVAGPFPPDITEMLFHVDRRSAPDWALPAPYPSAGDALSPSDHGVAAPRGCGSP